MTAAGHTELRRIFSEARRLADAERAAFLDEACRGERGLREEVEALLAMDAEADEAFDAAGVGAELLAGALVQSGELALPAARIPERLGRYRIVRVIAEGGMGVVYEAEQDDPQRRVALKVVRPALVTPDLLRRFRHESRVLAYLRHPGIAQVFEAGTADTEAGAQPFFAMELVEGEPLDEYARSHGLDTASRLELIARVCDVLQYAHQKGVVHRDLKPANILVTTDETTPSSLRRTGGKPFFPAQPKILDFGVARVTDGDLISVTQHTAAGQLIGTVPYMSPEQASGDPAQIDTASDVYAVGVLAYELLAGRLPYDVRGKLVHEAMRIIREEEPPSLGEIDRTLRGDVETIVAKALEKDRERRYASAAELAADVRRHLAHEPIAARPASAMYQLKQFARRNKGLVGGAAATLAVAILGALVATSYAIDAHGRTVALVRAGYISGLAVANSAVDRQDYVTAAEYLDRLPEEQRGWEYDYLRARLVHYETEWELPAPLVSALVLDAEGRRMFGMLADATLCTWDVASGAVLRSTKLDGARVVTSGGLPTGALLHGPTLRCAANTTAWGLALFGVDGRVAIPSASEPVPLPLSWDAAGERLLYTTDETFVWDGTRSRRVLDERSGVGAIDRAGTRVALSPRGVHTGSLVLLDIDTGELLESRRLDDGIRDMEFSPDDRLLAVAGQYANVFLLDGRTLGVVARLTGHQGAVQDVTWNADGSRLVTTSADGTVRIWNPRDPGASIVHDADLTGPSRAAFLPDGLHVVAGAAKLKRFLVETTNVLRGHESYVYRLSFSPDGSQLASVDYRSETLVWDVPRARLSARIPKDEREMTPPLRALAIDFSADGSRLVGVVHGRLLHRDLETGAALPLSTGAAWTDIYLETLGRRGARLVGSDEALSRDGRRLAICRKAEVAVYETGSADLEAWRFPHPESTLTYTREGLAPSGQLRGHAGEVLCAAFSPDGTRIATGSRDKTVRIWDATTYEQLLVLRGHTNYVADVQFSPDGTHLASASGDTTIRLWDTKPLHERRALGSGRDR